MDAQSNYAEFWANILHTNSGSHLTKNHSMLLRGEAMFATC